MSQDDVRLSPDLIAKLNALATYLTEQGEYDAVDLIDTVVARVTAMPQRELLREALEALQGLHDDVVEYVTLNKLHDADGSPAINNHWMRRARAAADKIRAALTQEPKT